MDPKLDTTGSLSELIDLKAKIEQENCEIEEENETLRVVLKDIEDEIEKAILYGCDLHKKLIQSKIESDAARIKIKTLEEHTQWQKEVIEKIENEISDDLCLTKFENEISTLREKISGALSFYGEESIEYELAQRSERCRQLRVELTAITADVERKKKDIEEKRKAREAAKLAEEERLRKEEERLRKEEQEKAMAEKAKEREQFILQKVKSTTTPTFRAVTFNVFQPESNRSTTDYSAVSAATNKNSNPDTTRRSAESIDEPKKSMFTLPSFSQFTRF